MNEYLLIDDFSGDRSVLETVWQGFSDRVMGGASDLTLERVGEADGMFLRLRGHVSLENRGGFIQARLMLNPSGGPFDGTGYAGIQVTVRGEGTGYYLFVRTTATILPWKYFAAPVPVSAEWETMGIPWSAFEPGDRGLLQSRMRRDKLVSVALVAYGKEFDASVDLKQIGMYGVDPQ